MTQLESSTGDPDDDDALRPSNPRVWTVFAAIFLALFLAIAIQLLLVSLITAYLISTGTAAADLQKRLLDMLLSPPFFIASIVVGPGSFGVVAVAVAFQSPQMWRERLGFVRPRVSLWQSAVIVMGSFFPLAVGIWLGEQLVKSLPGIPVDESAAQMLDRITLGWSIPFVILIGVVPGFCEEMLYRGYVLRRLNQRWGPTVGIIVSSVLFGIAHIMPVAVVFATLIGFYLGYVAWKSGSIWPTIACHFAINSGVNLYRMFIKFLHLSETTQSFVVWTTFVLSVICCGVTFWILHRLPASQAEPA